MNTATNAVVENRMEPVTRAANNPQVQITGQWLFDNLVTSSQEQITRMDMIRELAKRATFDDIKKATKDMIELAHKVDVKNGVPEKERGPKRQQAMNVRTIVQNSFGALRLANDELVKLGYTEKTGYLEMGAIAGKALKAKGLKWNGTKAPTDEQKELAKVQAEKEAQAEAMRIATVENPQNEGEDDFAYFTRVKGEAARLLNAQKAEATERVLSNLAKKLIVTCDNNLERYEALAHKMLDIVKNLRENTDAITPEQADEALKAYAENEEDETSEDSNEEVTQ